MPELATIGPTVAYESRLSMRPLEQDNSWIPEVEDDAIPFRSNLAAASQLFPLLFCCRGPNLFVLDLENRIKLVICPREGSVINYLRLGILRNSEVLGCVLHDGYVFIWKTHDLLRKITSSWLQARVNNSCWGLAFHRTLPLIATSDNSGSVLLHRVKENDHLEILACRGRLRGNIPSVEFVYPSCSPFLDDDGPNKDEVYIAYSKLYVHLLSGAIGILKFDGEQLDLIYEYQIDQACWTCRFFTLADCMPVSNSYELSGNSQREENMELPVECVDHVHEYCSDPPMLWIQRQYAPISRWIRTGRRELEPPISGQDAIKSNAYLFSTSASQAFLTQAYDFKCCAYTRKALVPPNVLDEWELGHAVSMVEVVSQLNLIICATRAKSLILFRLTRQYGRPAFRQEAVIWGDEPIVGFCVAPLRAHDLSWDSDKELLDESFIGTPPLGSTGSWILSVFFDNDEISSFELSVDTVGNMSMI